MGALFLLTATNGNDIDFSIASNSAMVFQASMTLLQEKPQEKAADVLFS